MPHMYSHVANREMRCSSVSSLHFIDFIVGVCYVTATLVIVNHHVVPVVNELSNPDLNFTIKIIIYTVKMSEVLFLILSG